MTTITFIVDFAIIRVDHRRCQVGTLSITYAHEPVIKLIGKITNLVAVCIPDCLRTDTLMVALVKCSKLEHLEFWGSIDFQSEMAKPLRSKLTCLAAHGEMSDKTIMEMTSLKHFHYQLSFGDNISLDQLIILLKNGLVGLKTTIRHEHWDTICKLGSWLEHLNVSFSDGETDSFSSRDVRQIVSSLRRLKKLDIEIPMENLALLKGLEHLEDLTIDDVSEDEVHLFKEAMKMFGHRLKALRFDRLEANCVVADIAKECCNLESLEINNTFMEDNSPDFEIANLPKLPKLRVLKYDFSSWTVEKILELFTNSKVK